MAKKDEKLQAYEELTTQMNASTVTLDAEKRQKLHEILHQKPEFAQLLEKFKALCSDDETRKAISEVCPASEADEHFDFKAMLQSMGAYGIIDPENDGYTFNWPGKQMAIQLANDPTENTLIPDKADSRDWDTTQNIYIEGDNLEALKCLRNAYAGKVKMIYIDPPYNTDADVIYNDYFHGEKVSSDDAGKHTKWLNMMYSRLMLARELLMPDGVIFISIDDIEQCNLRIICDKIFGGNNFIENYIWESTFRPDNSSSVERENSQHVICYAKNKSLVSRLYGTICGSDGLPSLTKNSMKESILTFYPQYVDILLKDGIYRAGNFKNGYELLDDVEIKNGEIVSPFRLKGRMIWSQSNLDEEIRNGTRIVIKTESFVPYTKKLNKSILTPNTIIPKSVVGDILQANAEIVELFGKIVFSHPKPTSLVKYLISCVLLGEQEEQAFIVMDFFSGSGTSGDAVCKYNLNSVKNRCKYILVQIDEEIKPLSSSSKTTEIVSNALCYLDSKHKPHNIAEIGKERIRRAGDKIKADNPRTAKDLDIGFRVFRVGKSNIPKWWAVDDAQRQLNMFDNEEEKRTDEEKYRAIAYEFMLKHKCMLDARVDEYLTPEQMAKTGGKPLFVVDGALFICPMGGVNAAWAASVVALRRSRYAMTSNDAWFVAVNDTLDDSSDNRDSDKLLAVKTLVEAGLPAKHFLHI